MKEQTFKLKKGTEFPERFAGLEARYTVPETLDEIRGLVAEGVDPEKVIVGFFNGQGYSLSVQKRIKDTLATDAVKEMTPEDAVAFAVEKATSHPLGAPIVRGEGKKARVEQAEARATAAVGLAAEMYRRLPKNLRRTMRDTILAQGVLTAEELDAIDNEQ